LFQPSNCKQQLCTSRCGSRSLIRMGRWSGLETEGGSPPLHTFPLLFQILEMSAIYHCCMDKDLEYIVSNSGDVGIFLPPLAMDFRNFRINDSKLILLGHELYFELNPPPLFLAHASTSGRIILVECKRGAIFKEYEIKLEVAK
jgi:hypothetical protein